MNTIDQRIVEMQFDNKQFEKNASVSMKTLDELKEKLGFKGVQNGVSSVVQSLEKLNWHASWLGRNIDRQLDGLTRKAAGLMKSLSIDQVSAGWNKYAQKTASVQTIVNATGKSIKEVNGYLDKLMWFSDETSYGFTDMTSALGQLTSAGGDIEKLIPMIEGIANATAFAGKGASEFSRVIYNLNQSYSQGHLSLMDWKSVSLAGVDSKQLKDTMIEAGVAMGTVKKQADGTYKTLKGTVITAGTFANTLSEKWATTAVMEKGFGAFAEMTEKAYELVQSGKFDNASEAYEYLAESYDGIGITAAKAAQEAKTFIEAIDATKDAVSSGWMRISESIFGDYEQAKVLWTDLANGLWDQFARPVDALSESFKEWSSQGIGGRADLLEGVYGICEGLVGIIGTVRMAFSEIFPVNMVEKLSTVSLKVKEFGNSVREAYGVIRFATKTANYGEVTSPIEEFETLLKKGMKGDTVKRLQQRLIDLGYNVGPAGADGIFGPKTLEGLKAFQKDWKLTTDGIYGSNTHKAIAEALGGSVIRKRLGYTEEQFEVLTVKLEKIKSIAKGVFGVFKIGGQTISGLFRFGLKALSVFSPLGDALLTVSAALGNFITGIANSTTIRDAFNRWGGRLSKWVDPIRGKVKKAADSVLDFFGLTDRWKKLREGNAGIITPFQRWFNNFSSGIKGVANKIRALPAWKTVGETWETAKKNIIDGFSKTFGSKLGQTEQLKEKIKGWFKKAFDKLPAIVETIAKGLNVAIEWAGKGIAKLPAIYAKIKTFITDVWNSLKGNEKFKAIAEKVKSVFASIKDAIGGFFSGENSLNTNSFSIKDGFAKLKEVGKALKGSFVDAIKWIWDGLNKLVTIVFKSDILKVAKAAFIFFRTMKLVSSITKLFNSVSGFIESKTKNTESIGDTLLKIAGAIAIVAGVIVLLGSISRDTLKQGSIAAGGIIAALAIIIGVAAILNKTGKVSKALGGLGSLFIGLAATIAAVVVSIRIFGSMAPEKILKGISALLAVFVLLTGFVVAINKFSGGGVKLSGFAGLAGAILMLTTSIALLALIPKQMLSKGMSALSKIMLLLAVFSVVASRIAKPVKMTGFIALAAAIGILVGCIVVLAAVPKAELAKAIDALTNIILAFSILTVASSFGGIGQGIGALLSALGMVAVLAMFVSAVEKIKDVDASKIENLTEAIQKIMLALSITMVAGKIGGLMGAAGLLATIGVIALVIAAIAGLQQIPGFNEFMNGVFDGIGTAFGHLVGSFQGTRDGEAVKAMAKSLEGLGNININEAGLDAALGAAGKIRDFAATLPEQNLIDTIANCLFGSNLSQFSKGMTDFGDACASLADNSESFGKINQENVDKAIGAATAIKNFADSFDALSLTETLSQCLLGTTPFAQFSTDMATFATEIAKVSKTLAPMDSSVLVEKVPIAVEAAKWIQTLTTSIPQVTFGGALLQWVGADSGFGTFCDDMGTFATKIKKVSKTLTSMDSSVLVEKVPVAVEAAKRIQVLVKNIPKIEFGDKLLEFLGANSEFGTFCDDMGTFANNMQTVSTNLSKLPEDLTEKTQRAVDAATKIKELAETIDPRTFGEAFNEWITGDTSFESFAKGVATFAEQMALAGTNLVGISEGTFAADMGAATAALQDIFAAISAGSAPDEMVYFDTSAFNEVILGLEDLGEQVSAFDKATENLDTARVTTFMNSISSLISAVSALPNMDVTGSVGKAKELVTGISSAFSEGVGEIDVTSGLIGALSKANTAIRGYYDTFKSAGKYVGQGIGFGISDSRAFVVEKARYVSKCAVEAIRKVFNINSPSKVTYALGEFVGEGLANGISDAGRAVSKSAENISTSALDSIRGRISSIASLIDDNIDTDPVVCPVVDLSNVDMASKTIGGIFSDSRRLNVGMSIANANASAVGIRAAKKIQNGESGVQSNGFVTENSAVNLTGNNFYIRSDNDVRMLASEIAALTKQQQRSYGAG